MPSLVEAPSHPLTRVLPLIFVFLLSLLGCAARPSPHRWLFFIPIASLSLYLILDTRTADAFSNYPVNLTLALNMFVMSDFLVLTDVQNVMRKKGQQEPISGAPFQQRIRWAFDLMSAYRGVGWNHEPTVHLPIPKTPIHTRRNFFLDQIFVLGKLILAYCICELVVDVHPSFAQDGPPFSAQVWWLRPAILAQGLGNMVSMGIVYWALGAVFVGIGYSEPNEWPPLYGSLDEMYSVRNFWGRVWHQAFRRFLTAHGDFLVKKLGLTNGRAPMCVKVWVAFFLSSLVHFLGGDWAVCGWNGGSLLFFNIQPIAIALEMAVGYMIRKIGLRVPTRVGRAVGYAWVMLWFTLTFPICVDPLVRAGFLEHRNTPVVISYVLRPAKRFIGNYSGGGK